MGRKVSRDDQLALRPEGDESSVKQPVVRRREHQAIERVKSLSIGVAAMPGLDVTGHEQLRVGHSGEATGRLHVRNAVAETALTAASGNERRPLHFIQRGQLKELLKLFPPDPAQVEIVSLQGASELDFDGRLHLAQDHVCEGFGNLEEVGLQAVAVLLDGGVLRRAKEQKLTQEVLRPHSAGLRELLEVDFNSPTQVSEATLC